MFILADVCIDCPQSLQYMFQIADIAGDQVLDFDEFDFFFKENQMLLEQRGPLVKPGDVIQQMQDMVKYSQLDDFRFSQRELLRSRMWMNLFDTMFSCPKFQQFEQRDQYVANVELQSKRPANHCQSGVWRQFWSQTYDAVAGE